MQFSDSDRHGGVVTGVGTDPTDPGAVVAGDRGPLLRVAGLTKHFPLRGILPFSPIRGWVHAVDGISFDMARGETVGLVGESGCGKTTTSRLVLRLEEPTSGAIYYRDHDIQKLGGRDLRLYHSSVAAVFQDPYGSLNPRMRVRDIVEEPLVINADMTRSARRERVNHLLREVGLEPAVAGNFPHEFSGGQRQRIAVARALGLNSQLIVLDEPVSALDVSIRAQIMNLLKDLQRDHGMSYLLIAHNLATVRYLSHQVAVMYLGRIVEHAASEDLFTKPLHPYTHALISASMTAQPHDRESVILRGEVPSPVNPPAGCRFHPRCPLRVLLDNPAKCEEEEPPLRELGRGHTVACHFAEQQRAVLAPENRSSGRTRTGPPRITAT